MKNLLTLFIVILFIIPNLNAQNVGINNTGAPADNSALLDLSSTNKGFLITRVDTASIVSPAFGLMTLAPIDSCLYMYSGATWISLGGVGSNCPCSNSSSGPPPSHVCGTPVTFTYESISVTYGTVSSNTIPSRCWLDRNLGASQVATSITDAASYGDFFQWGRLDDLHQNTTSGTTPIQSTTDVPGHGNYITVTGGADWRNPQNNSLWQGVAGINNPCPTGFRLPTSAEYNAERLSWGTNNSAGAFGSPLKLPTTGARSWSNGTVSSLGSVGHYWSSSVNGTDSEYLGFYSTGAAIFYDPRSFGFSVRCIKD